MNKVVSTYSAVALLCFCLLTACKPESRAPSSAIFGQAEEQQTSADFDLSDMQAAGELIAVTLSGPDTYYEYRGQGFGLEFSLTEAFARSVGTRLRMEMAADTAELFRQLETGEADMIALPLDTTALLHFSGDELLLLRSQWVVRSSSEALAEAVEAWWRPDTRQRYKAAEASRTAATRRVHRRMRPPMQSPASGTISSYDPLFIRHAQVIGWDWRLLAAQCYQESGFDPNATSWAGARGLMQLMPATAARLGVSLSQITEPSVNIEAAVRYLAQLNSSFADIRSRQERICFVLAAYNGGAGHVRDAMALAGHAGHDVQRWDEVEPFVLALSKPQYYRNPMAKFGYLRGEETIDYVRQIQQRWAAYRGYAHPHSSAQRRGKVMQGTSRVRPRSEFLNDSVR